jgi:predicted DNA-binding protein YlxM (UPF0122 family)
MAKDLGGRPSKQTPVAVKKLEEAFAMDCSIEEACFYAGISRQTYYTWIKDNPELLDRFEELKQEPFLKARKTILDNLDQPEHAKWYMERKRKNEFAQRTESTGKDGKDLIPEGIPQDKQAELLALLKHD